VKWHGTDKSQGHAAGILKHGTSGKKDRKSPVWTGIWAGIFRDFAARCASDAMDCATDGFFEKGKPR